MQNQVNCCPTGLDFAVGGGGGAGTVTSVGLAAPASVFSVSGSPVTTSGTLTLSLITQTANRVFVGPSSGAPANPTFRQLVANDLNTTFTNGQFLQTDGSGNLSWASVTGGGGTVTSVAMTVPATLLAVTGTPITTSGTLAVSLATQTANKAFIGPVSGAAAAPTWRQIKADDLNTTYSNNQVLKTDGSGNLSWTTPAGSPGGSDTYVQYNAAGSFGGNSGFAYDYTNNLVTITKGATNGSPLRVNNSVVSSGSTASVYVNHADTNANSSGYFVTGNTSAGWGLQIQGFSGTSGEDIRTNSTGTRRGYYAIRGGSTTSVPIVEINQSDSLASSILSASFFNGAINKSVFQVWGATDSGANRGGVGFRLDTYPSNAVVEIPSLSGDTKPTVFIGSGSVGTTALKIQSGAASSYVMQALALGVTTFSILGGDTVTRAIAGGDVSHNVSMGGLAYVNNVDTPNVSTTPTAAWFFSGTSIMLTAGDTLYRKFAISLAANSNSKSIEFDFGGSTIFVFTGTTTAQGEATLEVISTATAYNAQKHTAILTIYTGSTSTQYVYYGTTGLNMLFAVSESLIMTGVATNDLIYRIGLMQMMNHPT